MKLTKTLMQTELEDTVLKNNYKCVNRCGGVEYGPDGKVTVFSNAPQLKPLSYVQPGCVGELIKSDGGYSYNNNQHDYNRNLRR